MIKKISSLPSPTFRLHVARTATAVRGGLYDCAGLFLDAPNRFARAVCAAMLQPTMQPVVLQLAPRRARVAR